jgi:hypothetical protein
VSWQDRREALYRKLAHRLVERRHDFEQLKHGKPLIGPERVVIIGDRPGPGAPKTPRYHHTPFYSLKNCSGWLNVLLEEAGIPEERLCWINAADENGKSTDPAVLGRVRVQRIIALGGNAAKWLERECGITDFVRVDHPQYHKRFRYSQPYPLIEQLRSLLSL